LLIALTHKNERDLSKGSARFFNKNIMTKILSDMKTKNPKGISNKTKGRGKKKVVKKMPYPNNY
jgi:hypothetical protein